MSNTLSISNPPPSPLTRSLEGGAGRSEGPRRHSTVTRPQSAGSQFTSPMKQKILIVDDEPDALELIKVNLSNAGFFVATAEDGDEAIKKARAILPGLIMLD